MLIVSYFHLSLEKSHSIQFKSSSPMSSSSSSNVSIVGKIAPLNPPISSSSSPSLIGAKLIFFFYLCLQIYLT